MAIEGRRWRGHLGKWLIVLLLGAPMLASVVDAWRGVRAAPTENRYFANFPGRPATWDDALKFPSRLDLWINDHLGWRAQLITLNNWLRFGLFGQFPTQQVLQGRNGRVFLATHTGQKPYGAILAPCGEGFAPEAQAALATQLDSFASVTRSHGLEARLIIGPSPPVMYPEDLPPWLERRCAQAVNPLPAALRSPVIRDPSTLLYPLQELRDAKAIGTIMPATWFHWAGTGTRTTAALAMSRFWPEAVASAPLKTVTQIRPSDLAFLVPGFSLETPVETVDFAASGVEACVGPACFPELRAVMDKLGEASRFRNPAAAQDRLVLVADSYGLGLAPWFSRYFREVVHINTNLMQQLTPAQTTELRGFLFGPPQSGKLVFVYHDATVLASRIPSDFRQLMP